MNTINYIAATMRRHGSTSRINCLLLTAMLLFAQAAFATQPCVTPSMSAAQAIAGQNDDDCCASTASAVSLCVMKCTDGDKLSAHMPLPALPAQPTATLNLPQQPDTGLAAAARCQNDPRAPPKTILFCSLLI